MCLRRFVAAGVLGLATGVNAGQPAAQGESRGDHPDKAADRQSAKKKGDDKARDLASCKRDARGLEGPERARFMTECLKTRE